MAGDSSIQSSIFGEYLKMNLRSIMKRCTKPQHDEIQKFVMKYFGREMKGETDRAEFKKIIQIISNEMGVSE